MPADPETLHSLKRGLRSDDIAVREDAATQTIAVARDALVPVLTEALLSGTPAVCERALALLEHHAGAEAADEARRIVLGGGSDAPKRLAPVLARVLAYDADA